MSFSTVTEIIQGLYKGASEEAAPDLALVDFEKDGIEQWSTEKLTCQISQFEKRLGGVAAQEHVILLAANGPLWIACALAVIKRGAILVPVDVQLDLTTLEHIIDDCKPVLLVTTAPVVERLGALARKVTLLILDEVTDDSRNAAGDCVSSSSSSSSSSQQTVTGSEIATMFYTSGTTGMPKGVPLSHANLVYQVNMVVEKSVIGPGDRVLLPLPMHHIYPFAVGFLTPLAMRLPIILPQELTGPQLLRAIKEARATVMIGVPRVYSAMYGGIKQRLEKLGPLKRLFVRAALSLNSLALKCGGKNLGKLLLKQLHAELGPDLRILACGGAPLDREVAEKLNLLGFDVVIGYGLTETSPLISLKLGRDLRFDTVGEVLPGTEVRIAGKDSSGGEIQVRGPGVCKGYYNLPEVTQERISADGWFATGDSGFLDGRHLSIVGRMSSLIVTESGEKIDPEILEQYYGQGKLISELGILQVQGRLVAVILPDIAAFDQKGGDLDRLIHDAVDELSMHLPTYKRLTGYVLTNEPLARTAMAKLQRHKLVERYHSCLAGQSALPCQPALSEGLPGDSSLLENPLAAMVWEHLRSNYGERGISLDSSPQLDLGIDSLEWLNLSLEIARLTNVEVGQDALSDLLTVRDLLCHIVQRSGNGEHGQLKSLLLVDSPEAVLTDEQKIWLEPLTASQNTQSRAIFSTNRFLMRALFSLQVKGVENLSLKQAVILTPNHSSYLDAFALAAALSNDYLEQTHWAGWIGIAFANETMRALSRLGRGIPIDADRAMLTSIALAGAVLARKRNLVWFPEGRRTLTGDVLPFRPGIGLLLEKFPVPVVPVYISGTADALPPGSAFIRLKPVSVVFGEPVTAEILQREGQGQNVHERITNALRERVCALKPQAIS